MDSKLRETENLAEDGSAKKKFNFKSFKKFFGKKKRKEVLPDVGSSGLKQSQSASDVTMPISTDLDYDSEDEIEAAAGVLGSRAVSHDSIFIPEKVQETDRPVRIFSQENVSDHIRALQAKIQSNIRHGPPPFGMVAKRGDDTGTSSEDDGLPRSPPEMSLMHEAVKTRFFDHPKHLSSLSLAGTGSEEDEQISSGHSSRPLSPEEKQYTHAKSSSLQRKEGRSLSPSADFDTPAQLSTFLDSSAARHRLSVKPRNQRTSKIRRSSAVLQEETLVDLTTTEEEPECDTEEATSTPTQGKENSKSIEVVECGTSPSDNSHPMEVSNLKSHDSEGKQNEIVMGDEPQISLAQTEISSDKVELSNKLPSALEHTNTYPSAGVNAKTELGLVDALLVKSNERAPCRLNTVDNALSELVLDKSMPSKTDQSPKLPLSNNEEKEMKEHMKSLANEAPPVVEEFVITKTKSDQILHSLDSLHINTLSSQSPSTVDFASFRLDKSKAIQEQPDKENNKLVGNLDKKLEKPNSDIGPQRKFSVSSAWERPRGGSFSFKGNVEGESLKNMKLSLSKSEMPSNENEKDDPRLLGSHPERKVSARKKGNLTHSEYVSTDKAAVGCISSEQSSTQAASDMSVVIEPQAGNEEKNPFFVKLRSTSMSLRYRDGVNQESNRAKRHSSEIRQEKTGRLSPSKDGCTEASNTEISSKTEMLKAKTNVNELTHARPALPKKPVLQNITVADNNTNKEASECVPQQEKKVKSPETRAEKAVSERRLSIEKQTDNVCSPTSTEESAKGAESKEQPSWISRLQKQRSLMEEQGPRENKLVNKVAESPTTDKERTEALLKPQGDLVQNKTSVAAPGLPELHGQEIKAEVKEQRQRSNTMSHPINAEKEQKPPVRRNTQSASEEPSWMELAKKKAQAWSDMPQIIK
ncbi:CRACD-like protein isoform X1 [Pelobates fuscus]|uniref:CRACD-like protein isoform X1 n=1 Tax=Pelobates fuscus TaxID=191477 RepID=UPI002FE46B9B